VDRRAYTTGYSRYHCPREKKEAKEEEMEKKTKRGESIAAYRGGERIREGGWAEEEEDRRRDRK
jgi:hypothetical protein